VLPNGGVSGLLVKPGAPGNIKSLTAGIIFLIFLCINPSSFTGLPFSS